MDGHERHQITVGAKIDVKLLGPPRGGIGQLPMYRMVRNDLDVPLAIEVGKYPAAQRRNLLPNPSPDWIEQKSRNRAEENTSELQSLMRISYAVFCLKKK